MKLAVVVVCVVAVVLVLGGYYIFSGKSETSSSAINNTPNPGNAAVNTQPSGLSDCGVVSEEDMKIISTNQNAPKNEMLSCMSDNMNHCKISQIKFGCTTAMCSEDTTAITDNSGSTCRIKYTEIKTGNSITCDFPKTYLQQIYTKAEASSRGWATSLSVSLLLGFQLSFGQAGNLPLNVTDTSTGNTLSFPCTTIK